MTFNELQDLTAKNSRAIADLIVAMRLNSDATRTTAASVETLTDTVRTLTGTMGTMTGTIGTLTDMMGTLVATMGTLADTIGTFADSITRLEKKVDDYIAAAEARSKEQDKRMDALIHIVDDLVRDRWRRKNNGDTEKS